MAKVISFEQSPEESKIVTCPFCKAIIKYTKNDVRKYQTQGEDYITCPNCERWFFL